MVTPGDIVFLNGGSSAGKSTLALAVQDVMERPFLHTGIDQYFYRVPSRLIVKCGARDAIRPVGWVVVYEGDTMVELRIGPEGRRVLGGMYKAVAALAGSGIDVIVDDVLWDRHVLASAVSALSGCHVLFVGVRCPLEIAERRERERPERARGAARTSHQIVHAHGVYDLEIDTSLCTPAEGALRIKAALESRAGGQAFEQLRTTLVDGLFSLTPGRRESGQPDLDP